MNILWVASNYPTPRNPSSGVFISEQAVHIGPECELEVLALIPWFPPLARYAEQRRLLTVLPKRLRYPSHTVKFLRVPYVPPWRLPEDAVTALTSIVVSLVARRWVRRRRGEPDLIHAHMGLNAFTGAMMARVVKVPLITTVYGSDINLGIRFPGGKRFRRWAQMFGLRSSQAVIGVSKALCREVVELGVSESKVHHIPNGFDESKFFAMNPAVVRSKLGLGLSEKIVLYVGNLVRVKGVDVLIDAFTRMRYLSGEVLLYCVGDGPDRGRLQAQAKECGLSQRVVFVGRRPHAEIPLWMNACDLFVMASRNEGWPTVLSEVLACGKPVVATAVGGIPEIVRHKFLGELVEPEAPAALAASMLRILRRQADSNAIQSYAQQFSWRRIAAEILRVYDAVSEGGEVRPD